MYPEYMKRLKELMHGAGIHARPRARDEPGARNVPRGRAWPPSRPPPHLTAQRATPRPVKPAYDDGIVEALTVKGNVHLVAGSGANITVQVAPEGLLVVDSSVAAMSEKVLAAIRTISDKPLRHIINTSGDEHHTGGNENLSNSGRNLNAGIGGQNGREPSRLDGAPVIAHENVLHLMSGLKGEPEREPYGVWPHDTFYTGMKQLYFGGEVVEMLHAPAAHTDGDVMVWFRKSDVVATGDIYSTVTYPQVNLKRGGSMQGLLDALNRVLDIAVPEFNNQGGTLVVPGHGRISNESDVAEYRDMTTIIRDRIKAMVDKGQTLAQVKAAGVTKDYDGVYSTPSWTGEMFIEMIYSDASTAERHGLREFRIQSSEFRNCSRNCRASGPACSISNLITRTMRPILGNVSAECCGGDAFSRPARPCRRDGSENVLPQWSF